MIRASAVPAATSRLRPSSIIYSTTWVRAGSLRRQTLLNANFNAPYFHDGRYDSCERVVEHFDRLFGLELTAQDQADLVAYLQAVGDGQHPYERDDAIARVAEIMDFASVLSTAIPNRDAAITAL